MGREQFGFFGAAAGGAIFELIRRDGPVSRAQLVRSTSLSKSTVSLHVDRLLKMGLVQEEARPTDTGPGRRSLLRFAADRSAVVGVELGVTSIDVALCNLDSRVLASASEPFEIGRGPVVVLKRVYEIVEELRSGEAGRGHRLSGIGIGLPGPVNQTIGSVVSPPIMPGWDHYPVRDEVSLHLGVPCVVDNDVNVMAIGEARAQGNEDVQNLLFVKIGTGIGAGIIVNGEIYRGSKGSAGDIGHIAIDGESTRCFCGNRGCLEIVAGGGAIGKKGQALAERGDSPYLASLLRSNPNHAVSAVDVGTAAIQGDTAAVELIIESGRHIGSVLAKLVNFFNPEMIVLGGGVAKIGDAFIAAIREMVIRRSTQLATADLVIRRSVFGDQSGSVGAATMVVDSLYSNDRVAEMVRRFSE